MSDINVTPLVDVMLVLLIIFMVTAPMLASGMKVNLPNARTAQSLDMKVPIVITVTREGTVAIDGAITPVGDVGRVVKSRAGLDLGQAIQLRGDREASYGTIVEIIDQLARYGLTRFAVQASPQASSAGMAVSPP